MKVNAMSMALISAALVLAIIVGSQLVWALGIVLFIFLSAWVVLYQTPRLCKREEEMGDRDSEGHRLSIPMLTETGGRIIEGTIVSAGIILLTTMSWFVLRTFLGWPLWIFAVLDSVLITVFLIGYFNAGAMEIKGKNYILVSRLGVPYKVFTAGTAHLCFPGLIDEIYQDAGSPVGASGTFGIIERRLYLSDPTNPNSPVVQLDFEDASAAIEAYLWFAVDPNDPLAPFKFAFNYPGNSADRVENIFDAEIRPKLEKLTIDSARKRRFVIARDATANGLNGELSKALKEIGVKLDHQKGILIRDIIMPEAVQTARLKRLEGHAEADRLKNLGTGYGQAIQAIITAAAKKGHVMSWREAEDLFNTRGGYEVLQKAGNITLFGSDIGSILGSLAKKALGSSDNKPTKDKKGGKK